MTEFAKVLINIERIDYQNINFLGLRKLNILKSMVTSLYESKK